MTSFWKDGTYYQETDEDRIVVKFLESGQDPGRKARAILRRLFDQNQPISIFIQWALGDLFDPYKKPQRLIIKKKKPDKGLREVEIALDIAKELGRYTGPLTKRVRGTIADRRRISEGTVKRIWKEHCEGEKKCPTLPEAVDAFLKGEDYPR
jgi:hypothetical protein